MIITDTLADMEAIIDLLLEDMGKVNRRSNKRAMQRIRVNTVKFAKLAKHFRYISTRRQK
jgi:hypothetical protein